VHQLRRRPTHPVNAQSLQRGREIGDLLGRPLWLARDDGAHGGNALMLRDHPRQIGRRRECAHRGSAGTGMRTLTYEREYAGEFENRERVGVHVLLNPARRNDYSTASSSLAMALI